jgi:HEAT repeat protein
VIRVFLLLAAALGLAAQPKLLVNAQTDTRSAAAGLEAQFRALLAAQPQPAWVGYSVPAVRVSGLGCEYVRDGMGTAGVVHLEPPSQAVVLYRVEAGAVTRIRTVSPDCEIDAGGLVVHWLTDVPPEQSIALLKAFTADRERLGSAMLSAIGWHAGAAADQALESYLVAGQADTLRQRAIATVASSRGRHGIEVLEKLINSDPDERIRERAVTALTSSREPQALDMLVSIARTNASPRLRTQAIAALSGKSGKRNLDTLAAAAETDKDAGVRRRAISALQSFPDGDGIPALVQLARRSPDLEIRKQAMTALGNSRDPRALSFLEEVLK